MSLVRLRVVTTAEEETTLSVLSIVSIDGVPYDPNATPVPEKALSSRVTVLEEALASTIENLNMLGEACRQLIDPPTPAQENEGK